MAELPFSEGSKLHQTFQILADGGWHCGKHEFHGAVEVVVVTPPTNHPPSLLMRLSSAAERDPSVRCNTSERQRVGGRLCVGIAPRQGPHNFIITEGRTHPCCEVPFLRRRHVAV